MKCRFVTKRSERGIALVITLVMLAIVTVMAIVFLAVSRRERASVKTAQDLSTANALAEAALERAKAEAVARMAIGGSKLHYDLFNTTNFLAPSFTPQPVNSAPDPANVSYVDQNGNLLSGPNYLRMLANLQYDARPPVFIETNETTGQSDFRFYLDFNRNRIFETNGLQPELGFNGMPLPDPTDSTKDLTNNFVGDPEWIGVLERPEYPHSESNRFIGRFAYLVLPAGKTLDLNHIHNQADPASDDIIGTLSARNGYKRNQGVGSWEINLAAFLRELNTNAYAWNPATYQFSLMPGQFSRGAAFDDARAILAFRYLGFRSTQLSAAAALGPGNPFNPFNGNHFANDGVDEYSDDISVVPGGPIFFPPAARFDNDMTNRPWAGSPNTNAFTDLQQLFSLQTYSPALTNRLQRAILRPDNYDRYTFYRLAAQMGVDSTPALEGKLNLNYDNAVGEVTNTFTPWNDPVRFFTNAADLMLKASIDRLVTNIVGGQTNVMYLIGDTLVRTNFSITNIQIYTPPTSAQPYATGNEYTPTIHRILQLALNIYDNMTNKGSVVPYHDFPTVLRPIYSKSATNLYISGFLEETNSRALTGVWQDPRDFFATNSSTGSFTNYNFFGQHMVIGAKKGLPNFNELALQTYVEVSRKLELVKNAVGGTVNDTNQMFLVSILNHWGLETWNSYTNDYQGNLQIAGEVRSQIVIRDLDTNQAPIVFATQVRPARSFGTNNWPGQQFQIVLDQPYSLLRDVAYDTVNGFKLTNQVRFTNLEPAPRFQLVTTNDLRFWIYDRLNGRIIDFVSFDNLTTVMDLSTNLYSATSPVNNLVGGSPLGSGAAPFNENVFWDPTPVSPGSPVTVGITNQMTVSAGDIEVDDTTWKAYRFNSPDKRGGIAAFRSFMGLGLRSVDPVVRPSMETRQQTPFVPTRRMYQLITWQANDPLVHYMPEDLTRVPGTDKPVNLQIRTPLPQWNIGRINERYLPWGYPNDTDLNAYNMVLKDPGVRKSDDWSFPIFEARTNRFVFPNLGTLGQVHRGTPWQTVYLKSIYQFGPTNQIALGLDPSVWLRERGSMGGYPMNDWRLLDVFTTAPNETAARGLLSVNQTNRAAWSAVLSGITLATNAVRTATLQGLAFNEGLDPTNTYQAMVIDPATVQLSNIVQSINLARANQFDVVPNPTPAANPQRPWLLVARTNAFTGRPLDVFEHMGDVLSSPLLSVQSPYLNSHPQQVRHVWSDRAVEYIPQQILSLLQRDEPRFVVYAYGQSLAPAPRSLSTSADYYHLCTNYQITGEVITKTTFRVEGELRNPANPLRAVVESYNILPPSE